MSERAVPFYCPFCGDEDLRPHEVEEVRDGSVEVRSPHGSWHCRSCQRAFALRLLGIGAAR